jgi:hypothetical protein
MAADAKHPLAGYLAHGLTTTQRRYLDWLREQTGFEPDEKSFRLAVALRDQFAKSPDNKAYLKKRKEEREAAQAAVDKIRAQRESNEARADKAIEREVSRREAKADRLGKAADADGVTEMSGSGDPLPADTEDSLFSDDEPFEPERPAAFRSPAFSDGAPRRAGAEPY